MFNKVLVAEDLDSISIAVVQILEELSISEIHHAKYCDDALLKRYHTIKCVSKKNMRVCTNPHIFFTYTLYGMVPLIKKSNPYIFNLHTF